MRDKTPPATTSWDMALAAELRRIGLSQEQIGFVVGSVAEHRQRAAREGYARGFNDGHEAGRRAGVRQMWRDDITDTLEGE